MKRLAAVLVPLAVFLSACAVGAPGTPTSPTSTSIILNANVNSSIDGPVDFWFRYGERGDQENWLETAHGTVEITDGQPQQVSTPVNGLQPDHRYGWQVCVADQEEDPPRVVCSKEQLFGTVGDSVLGGDSSLTFQVRSGPGGENPAGTVSDVAGEADVTCLRVTGNLAAVGVDGGVYHLEVIEGSSGFAVVEFVEWPQGSGTSDCPQPLTDPSGRLIAAPEIRDAP